MRVYSDSVILIYYFEGAPSFKARATARLGASWTAGDTLAVSDLVRLERRVLPIRLGDAARLADYDNLFAQPKVTLSFPSRRRYSTGPRSFGGVPLPLHRHATYCRREGCGEAPKIGAERRRPGFFAVPGRSCNGNGTPPIIRATHDFKTTDSLHLAAAVESGCDRFLTNDTRLSAFTDLPVEVLP